MSAAAVKAPSCAVLKPKNSNLGPVDKVCFATLAAPPNTPRLSPVPPVNPPWSPSPSASYRLSSRERERVVINVPLPVTSSWPLLRVADTISAIYWGSQSLFKASDAELKALEDAIIDPSERENFQITTLSDATQYKVIRPRTVSESLSPVGPRFSPSKANPAFGFATVANADAVAPLKPASIWSPIKKTASFDDIQSQYY